MRLLIVFCVGFLLASCQSPAFKMPSHWTSTTIDSTFKHLLISNTAAPRQDHLDVYIEGDGIPFRNRYEISADPTPHNPLALRLMNEDKNASIYLGRPCYFALRDEHCGAEKWTSERYSDEIVASMVVALRHYLNLSAHKYHSITLIGYSGGGTLALLMAARMPEITQLVTVSANVDIDAWARLHDYTLLTGSINPANTLSSATPALQLHFIGERDENIPASIALPFFRKIQQEPMIISNADHQCCWVQAWPKLLQTIEEQRERTKSEGIIAK